MVPEKQFLANVAAGSEPGPIILEALEATREFLAGKDLTEHMRAKLLVVVEELVANVLRHGQRDRSIRVRLTLRSAVGGIALAIEDDGAPFDPTTDFEFTGPNEITGGGAGLEIVRTWVSELVYRREDSRNHLSLYLS